MRLTKAATGINKEKNNEAYSKDKSVESAMIFLVASLLVASVLPNKLVASRYFL